MHHRPVIAALSAAVAIAVSAACAVTSAGASGLAGNPTIESGTGFRVPPAASTSAPATTSGPTTWALIGDDTTESGAEQSAGITSKVVRISWSDFETAPGVFSAAYQQSKSAEIASLESAGMKVILDLGLQGTPQWIHGYPNSYLVDQYGEQWTSTTIPGQTVDDSTANLVFNPALRAIAAVYIARVAEDFGATVQAIRIGGGRDGELDYPPATTPDHTNAYWAFDALAQSQSPVPGWEPGDPSPNGQAQRFLAWYLGSLTNFETWQIATLRTAYSGAIIVLFPGWGIRPGQTATAASDDLNGASSAEVNGEIQRGDDFADQVAAIKQPGVWAETTWLDAPEYGSDSSTIADLWTPVHYLASLVASNPYHPELWGENTGQGTASTLAWTVKQACTYHVQGVVWFNEDEVFSGTYATLPQYSSAISGACR